jgi:hypothetical protein
MMADELFHETHFLLDFLPVKSCQKDFFLDFEGCAMLLDEELIEEDVVAPPADVDDDVIDVGETSAVCLPP